MSTISRTVGLPKLITVSADVGTVTLGGLDGDVDFAIEVYGNMAAGSSGLQVYPNNVSGSSDTNGYYQNLAAPSVMTPYIRDYDIEIAPGGVLANPWSFRFKILAIGGVTKLWESHTRTLEGTVRYDYIHYGTSTVTAKLTSLVLDGVGHNIKAGSTFYVRRLA